MQTSTTELEKTVMGLHFKVFRQQVELLHRETESFVDRTGMFPLSRDGGGPVADTDRRPIVPPVEMDQFETELSDLLSNEGGLQSDTAAKIFLRKLKDASLESHRILCVSVLRQTRAQPALAAFAQSGGFRMIVAWIKTATTVSFKLHIVEFLASPRVKLEKRAEKEVLKIVHDAVQTVVELACKGQTRTAGDPAPARPLTTDQAALRGAGQDLMKRLRAAMDVRAPLTAALTAPSVVGQKKKLSVTDSVSAERPQKKLRIDSTAKPLGGSTKAATPSPVASGPPRAGPVAPVTVPLGTSAGPLRSVALTAQPLKSPFASFNSDQQYSHASQRAIELQNIQDVYYKSAHVDVLAAVDSSRRRIRWADESNPSDLCATKEFLFNDPPCPDVAGLGDDGESEKQLPWATEEDGDAEGLRIDLALDPRHTHNLIQMKKKEHEGERQLLEQSRRHKHPAPEIAVQWRPPMLRSTEEANVAGSQTGVATLVDVYSNEIKIQKIRQTKKDEILYLLTSEIPDDPDHVSAPISGNVRMPTHIPWEIEYADEEFPAEEDSAVFTAADTEGQHSMDAYDCSNSTPVEAMTEFDEDMAMLLEIMPQSVLTLTPGQLDLLMKRLSEDNNVALLENPNGEAFQQFVEDIKSSID